jgi:midasin
MNELQRHRQTTQVFAGKHGFITLRDLFRWAERHPRTYEELANTGFMLLAERLRKPDEKDLIQVPALIPAY